MNVELIQSYEYCKHVAKTEARNFYYSFTVLPPEKRAAMCAIYAFMRYCDDLTDEAAAASNKAEQLMGWRTTLDRAFEGEYGDSRILPAFHNTAVKCDIPKRFFHELIDGAEMDLTKTRYETFDELYKYCYHVASVVGFVCIHVWGFSGGDAAYIPSEACGIAFQLTNILRDLKEDAERGRIYLPLEDLHKFGYSEDDLISGVIDDRFHRLMQFEVDRAKSYYERALPLVPMIDPVSRPTFQIMYRIYRGLLDKIEQRHYDVFSERASLSKMTKAGIVAQEWLGSRLSAGAR
jgi:phytoene synthase